MWLVCTGDDECLVSRVRASRRERGNIDNITDGVDRNAGVLGCMGDRLTTDIAIVVGCCIVGHDRSVAELAVVWICSKRCWRSIGDEVYAKLFDAGLRRIGGAHRVDRV